VNVTFAKDAFNGDPTKSVPYEFDLTGCMFHPSFVPRPVQYEQCPNDPTGTKYCPTISKQPSCDDRGTLIRSEVKGPESTSNTGKFVDGQNPDGSDYSKFEIVSRVPVSNIFEFTWCPAQDMFLVTVYKQGHLDGPYKGCPYIFRSQTSNVVGLQWEKGLMQAEIDQLKAEKTGTVKVVFV